MRDLETIERVLALKKRAAEQKLSVQAKIERTLKLEIQTLERQIKLEVDGPSVDSTIDVSSVDLQTQLIWLQTLQAKKVDLEMAVQVVRSKITTLQSEFGGLCAKHDIIGKQLSELDVTAQRERFAIQDQQRLENWRTGRNLTPQHPEQD